MKILGTFLTTFVLSVGFAFAQTAVTTTTTTTTNANATEPKAACCAGKSDKAACCKDGNKAHADAADGKTVVTVEETTTVSSPGGNIRRVTRKGDKRSSTKPQPIKE